MELFKMIVIEGLRFILQIGFFLFIVITIWAYFKDKLEQETKTERDMSKISFESTMMDTMTRKLVNEIDKVFITGLENKGYKFDNKAMLMSFVSQYVESVRTGKDTIYIVNGVPFLKIVETPNLISNVNREDGIVISADFGTYEYL